MRRWRARSDPARGRSRRRTTPVRVALWIAAGLFAFFAVCGVITALRLVQVRHDLEQARTKLDAAGSDIEEGRLAQARDLLERARTDLVSANNRLYNSVTLDAVSWMPIARQNVDSLRASVGDALTLVSGGARILRAGKPLEGPDGHLNVSLVAGQIPLAVVSDVQAQVDQLARLLSPASSHRPEGGLLGPVRDLQRKVGATVEQRRTQLLGLSHGLGLLLDMAGNRADRRYLIAVANSAEMRGAGGMILSYGVLSSHSGQFTLDAFGNIDELALDTAVDPASLELPNDYVQRWSGLEPTRLWRNTTLAPDLAFDAPVMEAMFKAKTGLKVDGVIQIDPAGLAAILRGIGPVDVDTVGHVTADNVVDLTLNKSYTDFPDRDQRQEVLGDVADVVFHKLVSGKFDSLRALGTALFDSANERHVIFRPIDEGALEDVTFFHADGDVPARNSQYALLTIQNFSKNKLDYYLDSSLSLQGTIESVKVGSVTARINVTNNTPPGLTTTYITGPNAPGEQRDLYRGMASLYLPTGWTLVSSSGGPTTSDPLLGSEDNRTVVSFSFELRPGETSGVTLQLQTAPRPASDPFALQLVPVPRVRPTSVTVDVTSDGKRAFRPLAPLVTKEVIQAGQKDPLSPAAK